MDLTNALNKVACVKNSDTKNLKSIYEIKPDFAYLYSPYFCHYTTSERAQADEKLNKLKKLDPNFFIKPANNLPKWQPLFTDIRRLLDSDTFLKIVKCVLVRIGNARDEGDGEALLLKLLYLIGLALNEDLNDLEESKVVQVFQFKFVEKCERLEMDGGFRFVLGKIIGMEGMLNERAKMSAEWTLNYYMQLVKLKVQKNDLTEFKVTNLQPPSKHLDKEVKEKQRLKIKAEKRRQKILSKFERQQQTFATQMLSIDDQLKTRPTCSTSEMSTFPKRSVNQIRCFGKERNIDEYQAIANEVFTCILCQEDNGGKDASPIIQLCYIQK